jgi:cytochrome P450
LANAQEQGTQLTETELFSTCIMFVIGGHETTTNLIGNGMFALLQRPDQSQRLKNDPQLIGSTVEEMLRYDAPTQRAHRIATTDIDLRGQTI